MNRTLSNVLLFAAGVVVGSAVTWKIFKSKYEVVEEDFDEEIDDEPEESNEATEPDAVEIAKVKASLNNKPPLKEYAARVQQLGYSDGKVADDEEEDENVYEPFIISPESYGELHAYDTRSLNYYADGVLTDDLDNPIEDVESLVPADFAEHFGDYEDDSVFVRNDNHECDYEILRDKRKFADVFGEDPYPMGDE